MTQRANIAADSRYRILGTIHRGGMGEILLARAEGADGFSRKLVLKGLLPQLSDDEVSHELFRREAMLMARLEHPNIVRVVDFTYVEDQPYLAMEYVRGRNLHQLIQHLRQADEHVPVPVAAFVLAQALRGLHYAHHARDQHGRPLGIIHRDISPGNILISFFGEVKVTDFGIAMAEGYQKHTGPRAIRGKARYTSPEIISGKPASIQSDVYAAGVVLAETLMGEPLWERGQLAQTLMAIVTEPRQDTLRRIFETIEDAPGLRAALRGTLARKPSDRLSSALQLAESLDAIGRVSGGPVTQSGLGEYMRSVFHDARDLPTEDGLAADERRTLPPEIRTDPSMNVGFVDPISAPKTQPQSFVAEDEGLKTPVDRPSSSPGIQSVSEVSRARPPPRQGSKRRRSTSPLALGEADGEGRA